MMGVFGGGWLVHSADVYDLSTHTHTHSHTHAHTHTHTHTVTSRPLLARPLQCRDRYQDNREQAGRSGLSHLDLPVSQDDAEP